MFLLYTVYFLTALIFELFFHEVRTALNPLWLCFSALAMEFHEKLQSLAAKEGLKGRKVTRALESFSWNITILKVSDTHTLKNPNSLRGRPLDYVLAFSWLLILLLCFRPPAMPLLLFNSLLIA